MDKPYFVYMLRCADNSLYTGIATNVARRFAEHGGKAIGAKYTASHAPLRVERVWRAPDRALALRLEYRIKTLTHAQKERLVADPAQLPELLGRVIDVSPYQEEYL